MSKIYLDNQNIDNIVKATIHIIPIKNTTKSSSEKWILEFSDNVYFEDKRITDGCFFKCFISPNSINIKKGKKDPLYYEYMHSHACQYEYEMYKITEKLRKYGICDAFPKMYAKGKNISVSDVLLPLLKTNDELNNYSNKLLLRLIDERLRTLISCTNIGSIIDNIKDGMIDIKSSDTEKKCEKVDQFFTSKDYTINCIAIENILKNDDKLGYKSYTLSKFIESHSILDDDIITIFYQIIYILYVFEQYKIVHNDLHLGNIIITKLPKRIGINYQINNKNYYFDTIYKVTFFDFDRSYNQKIGNNHILDNLNKKVISPNKFTKNIDIAKLVLGCFNRHYDREFIPIIINNEYINEFNDILRCKELKKRFSLFRTCKNIEKIFDYINDISTIFSEFSILLNTDIKKDNISYSKYKLKVPTINKINRYISEQKNIKLYMVTSRNNRTISVFNSKDDAKKIRDKLNNEVNDNYYKVLLITLNYKYPDNMEKILVE